MTLPPNLMAEADLFFSYLTADDLSDHSERLILAAGKRETRIHVCSELYDEIASALRSDGLSVDNVVGFLDRIRVVPHQPLPVTVDIATEALKLYRDHGGPRKLHYFDSFHVITARYHSLPLVTSDGYVLEHANEFGVEVIDLTEI